MTRAVCAALLLGLLGCGSPAVRFHVLPTPPPADVEGSVTVVVGPVRIPKHLNRSNIVWRDGPTRLTYDENNRWGSNFEDEILRAVTDHMSAGLSKARVVAWPAQVVGEDAIQISIEVQQMDATADGVAHLRARYLARKGTEAEVIAEGITTVRGQMDGDGPRDAVVTYGQLVEGLSKDIMRRLRDRI